MSSDESTDNDEEDSNGLVKRGERGVHNLYIMPPEDGAMTNEDSGEDDNVGISNLPASQLTASVTIGASEVEDSTKEMLKRKENARRGQR